MATTGVYTTETIEAAGDLSAKQYHFGVINSSGQIAAVGVKGAAADGVILNNPAAQGRATTVAKVGRVKVVAAGTITAGANVASDNAGKAIAAGTGDIILGKALEAAAANQVITIDFIQGGNASA